MAEFRFIHCADLHLGSHFAGFASRDTELAEKLTCAPWESFSALVDRAIAGNAAFVTIAGDVFEELSPPLHVWQKFLAFMEKLSAAGIDVFICAGNHDPLESAWKYASSLPENVKLFPAEPLFYPVEKDGKTIAFVGGISYETPCAPPDYAARLIKAVPQTAVPKFALLHTAVDGAAGEPYAPAALSELRGADLNGWLLGHVHNCAKLAEEPLIIYPGVLQGRAVNEPGEHCAAEISVDISGRCRCGFIPFSRCCFENIEADISGTASISEIIGKVKEAVAVYTGKSGIKVFRLTLSGTTELDRELRMENSGELHDMLCAALGRESFFEKIIISTRPGRAAELPAEAAEEIDNALEQLKSSGLAAEIIAALKKSFRGVPDFSQEEIGNFYSAAKERLLDKLSAGGVE